MHLGKHNGWNCSKEAVFEAMDKYNIDYGLISNIAALEFNEDRSEQESQEHIGQLEANDVVAMLHKKHANKIKGLFFVEPKREGYSANIEKYILGHLICFCGMKIHPHESELRFTIENYREYLDLCLRLNMVVTVHTEEDGYSDPYYVYQVAKAYPNLNFIMVHMGVNTDHKKAIEYISKLPNLYGDTTSVEKESLMLAVEKCGSSKILFGSGAPKYGVDTYKKYEELIEHLNKNLPTADVGNILYRNADRLFKLNLVKE
jgi:predicted TIM-barrel fold metal-dependent hydrolase